MKKVVSGFEFPVEQLSFVITMPPGNMPNAPKFTSIYRQESIASDLTVTVSSNQIIGASKTILNDHEGITMTMLVDQKMFPTVSTYTEQSPVFLLLQPPAGFQPVPVHSSILHSVHPS